MQTPSQSMPLPLYSPLEEEQGTSEPGSSLQKIIRFDLKEEGNHILAVNISYTEITKGESGPQATGGRSRNFRKLYQFIAQPCLSVRTKATEFPPTEANDKASGPYGKSKLLRYVLEAQLENVGDAAIVLEQTALDARPPFRATSLNWDLMHAGETVSERPKLDPRSIQQIAFLVEQEPGQIEGLETLEQDLKRDGRTILGHLSIEWRGPMGDRGFLSTGSLMTRKRG